MGLNPELKEQNKIAFMAVFGMILSIINFIVLILLIIQLNISGVV